MKKCIFLATSILAMLIGYSVLLGLASQDSDSFEIKKVLDRFASGFANQDADAMMKEVSGNYYFVSKEYNVVDYAEFRDRLEKFINDFFKIYTNFSHGESEITDLKIQDDEATLISRRKWRAFNLETLKEINGEFVKEYALKKENGQWKIIRQQLIRDIPQ